MRWWPGTDWGAPVAWHAALLRPDRVRGVIGLSVPYRPRGSRPPTAALRERAGDGFYMLYFQAPGVADAELARDLRQTFTRVLYGASGDAPAVVPVVPPGGGFLDICAEPPASSGLPAWLTSDDIDAFAAEYAEAGFTGPLNWYRNLDRSWSSPPRGTTPRSRFRPWSPRATATWSCRVPGTPCHGCLTTRRSFASWSCSVAAATGTQQERPDDVSKAMIGFIRELD